MTKSLSKLLANDHPLFIYNIAQLEKASGHAGIDMRLYADILERAHAVMRTVGLDTADTSARELYQALGALVGSGRAEEVLADAHFVLLKVQEEVVSFCLYDVIENAHHQLSFEERKTDHAQRYLRREVIKRYAEHETTHEDMVYQLAVEADIKRSEDEQHYHADAALVSDVAQPTNPKLLMIGDIFTDAFIKLNEKYSVVERDEHGKEWLKVPFGQKPPYEYVDIIESVGPSPNAAVSSARLGLNVSLMAWLGDDEPGTNSLKHLQSEGVRVEDMITQPDSKSSYWYVLRHGSDRTMLVKSESYDYQWKDPVSIPDWIYLAYIGADSWPVHEGLVDYLERYPQVKFVFQPATYHFEWGVKKLASLYRRAYMTVMNKEEAADVTGRSIDDIRLLAEGLHELGPEIVVITDGPHGSFAYQDGTLLTIPNYPDPAPPVDRTGAGDAFASTITAGLAEGRELREVLTWAPINSASVVQEIGAQRGLLTKEKLQAWLADAPDDYVVREL